MRLYVAVRRAAADVVVAVRASSPGAGGDSGPLVARLGRRGSGTGKRGGVERRGAHAYVHVCDAGVRVLHGSEYRLAQRRVRRRSAVLDDVIPEAGEYLVRVVMLGDGVAGEVQSKPGRELGANASEVVKPLEPTGVDARQRVVGQVQAIQVRQRVEHPPWQAGVGQVVACQLQRVASRRGDRGDSLEQVRRE